jgi:hypothetical protein
MKIATAPTKELGNLMLFRGQDINADLANSTKADKFAKASPERFLQMGIAEQNFIGAAVGLASVGYIPWLSIFAVFFTHRAVDPIRMLIAQTHANVKLGAAYAGAWRIKELLILGSEYAGETKTGTQNLRWLFVTSSLIKPAGIVGIFSSVKTKLDLLTSVSGQRKRRDLILTNEFDSCCFHARLRFASQQPAKYK